MLGLFGQRNNKPPCKICAIARIHIFLVVSILAFWRFQPETFNNLVGGVDRYSVPMAIVALILVVFVYKLWRYWRDERH
jgi:disulfide bond formation protein DsbB